MHDLLLALIPATVAAVLAAARTFVQAHVKPAQMEHVTDIARTAVRGAEQLGNDLSAFVDSSGAAKLDLAVSVVVSGAKRLGIKLSSDEALALVNAALREMNALAADVHA